MVMSSMGSLYIGRNLGIDRICQSLPRIPMAFFNTSRASWASRSSLLKQAISFFSGGNAPGVILILCFLAGKDADTEVFGAFSLCKVRGFLMVWAVSNLN